ncbi:MULTISPECIES: potassium channel family protein [Methylomonas]|uniref:potassium channel family protein n=1 Tax=Methylomonas TaxID=416 RepID=UPI0012320B8D|nr:NAD-binding protein [Methylomonas rhizoryzae]
MKAIAVFGYNRLSREAMNRIDIATHRMIVYDHQLAHVQQAEESGFDARLLDFRSDEELKSVGIGGPVDALLCCFEDDSENVFLTLSARGLDPDLQIIAIVENPDASEKLLAAGANKIIDPYQICGSKIHEMLTRPEITDLFDHTVFGRHDLHLAEVVVPERCSLLEVEIGRLALNSRYNLVLVGVVNKRQGGRMHWAAEQAERRLNPGDVLVILGPSREIRAFKQDVNDESGNV